MLKKQQSTVQMQSFFQIMVGDNSIALGAQFTYVSPVYLYGLMAGGQVGVEQTFKIFQGQMIHNIKLLGVKTFEELDPKDIRFLNRG